MTPNIPVILRLLSDAGVEFIVVGGVAGIAHGSSLTTLDMDVVYRRTPQNIRRFVQALQPHHPYLRGAPPNLPFLWEAETIERGLNFTLATDLGPLDLLGEILGGGTYEDLYPASELSPVYGVTCRVLDLPTLIRAKRAAGRPKDFEAIAILEALLEERRAGELDDRKDDSPS
ncbi:MAG: hypothetical protein WBC44_18435 [Planctomycetaceae bacterium]